MLALHRNSVISKASLLRHVTNRCKIGYREVVGYGINGSYIYFDNPAFPFPAIRFKETCETIRCLREKEMGDWRCLTIEEKKCLYRASFCATFAEFMAPTGQWKYVIGVGLILISYGFWMMTFNHLFVYSPLPKSFSDESQAAQLRRMIDLRVGIVDGLSSKWNYERDDWKKPGDD